MAKEEQMGFIWDVDGTLLDSMPMWNQVANRYLDTLGIATKDSLGDSIFAMTTEESARFLKEKYILKQSVEEIIRGINELIRCYYEEEAELKPGVLDYLKQLKKLNCPMVIATSTDRFAIEAAFKRLGLQDYFLDVFTCTEVGKGKGEPDIFKLAQQKLGTDSAHTWVVEDGLYSMRTAKSLGFSVIGVYDAVSEREQKDIRQISNIYVEAYDDFEGFWGQIQKEMGIEKQYKPKRRISVRNLVEFILREGDIDVRQGSGMDVDAMQAGAKLHRKIQGRGGSHYKAEVPLFVKLDVECAMLTVEGRADGIIDGDLSVKGMPIAMEERMRQITDSGRKLITIDEIKCMYRDVYEYREPEPLHLAQAKCYAYMYARQYGMDAMMVQLTYANLETEEIKRFWYDYSFVELEKWFFKVIWDYTRFLEFEIQHLEELKESARNVTFPFTYRKGQKELTAMIYSSMKRGEHLFCQAPTGVGKTISAVFPAVKAIGEELAEKIFYLTAKTITRTVAEESFDMLRSQGLKLKSVTISAKDKLCILEERECNPQSCGRAKGHYDRINECLYEMLTNEDNITRECITEYAEGYQVCPYELSLDVALWVDAVICDYNYLFDPKVQLKRFFSEQAVKGEYLFLIDEAHNLVERGRSMYSASLYKEDMLKVKRYLQPIAPKAARSVNRLNQSMLAFRKELERLSEEGSRVDGESGSVVQTRGIGRKSLYSELSECDVFVVQLMRFVAELEKVLEERTDFTGYDEVMEFYFNVHHFLNMYEELDENYVIYTEKLGKSNQLLQLFCVNPSHRLAEILNKGRSTIFFSATLLPVSYYKELLTGNQEDKAVYIPSPFARQNRYLAITSGVTSKYSSRSYEQYERIVDYLKAAVIKPGNYMAFFSSYKMMEDVYDVAVERGLGDGRRLRIQSQNMTEEERERFLLEFQEEAGKPLLAFCILGGIFSEGIDLKRDQLIGAFVVGNGLPQVCVQRDILQDYFKKQGMDGFAYAYIYPGMNKVLQAAGRVIRTEQDRGVILLMDDRFRYAQYRNLFPQEWGDVRNVNIRNITQEIRQFWGEKM